MAPPHYKLTYFNSRGRAEVSRLVLAAAGVEWEDERVAGEQWTNMKPKTPFGSLPVLCVDGKTMLGESMAIARYLAKSHGLAGKDLLEQAQADMLCDAIMDLAKAMYEVFFEKDPAKKEEMATKLRSETMPKFLCNLEKLHKCNHDGKGYLVGDGLTYADLLAFHILSMVTGKHPEALDKVPTIKCLVEKVGQLPKVKCWLEKRPKTDM